MGTLRSGSKDVSIGTVLSGNRTNGWFHPETGVVEVIDGKWVYKKGDKKGCPTEYLETHKRCKLPLWLVQAINVHTDAKVAEALTRVRQALGCSE